MEPTDAKDPAGRMTRALDRTRQIAQGFEGLSEQAARTKAGEHPDLQFQFVPWNGAVTLDLRSNRIRLFVRNAMVVSASAG